MFLKITSQTPSQATSGFFATNERFQYETLKLEHMDAVVDLFTSSFCEYEPMTKHLGIEPAQFKPFAQKVVEKAIVDGLSIVACDGKKIVACAIVEDIFTPDPLDFSEFDPKFETIFSLLEKLGIHYFEGKQFVKNNISHLFITAVDAHYHGCGLSKKVNNEAMKLSEKRGFGFMYCEFTNDRNEKGTIGPMENKKTLIGSCTYNDFVFKEQSPFQGLEGAANSYLWVLNPEAKLTYYQKKEQENELVSQPFDSEFMQSNYGIRK